MGFFEKLKQGMNKTKSSFDEKINNVFKSIAIYQFLIP